MNSYNTDQALATFKSGAADPHLFLVQSWRGKEAVSQLYRFEIDLASAQDNIDLAQLLGSRATFALRNQAGELVPWHGIITELNQIHRDESYAYYRAVLEPQLALLHLFKQSRIYVESNTQGGGDPDLATIIRTTLKQCGLSEEQTESNSSSAHYAIKVSASDLTATRSNFICQFEESTLNFLLRRLEQAGFYFWFEQNADRECVIFANRTKQQPSNKKNMFWRPAEGLNTAESEVAISRFEHTLTVQPKGVVLRDFSISQPSLNLTVQAQVSATPAASDRFDAIGTKESYGAHYNKQVSGESLAAIQAEEIACQRNRYTGEAQSIGLYAGLFVEMAHHFRNDFNQRYYVTAVQHEGKQSLPRQTSEQSEDAAFYHAHFTVLPADLQFRAPRTAHQPRVIGFISAIIMAEGEGEYAQMNEYGCYKVQFLFVPNTSAQEQANSAWVRMATPYAGSQHGMSFPLLKGTEVLVSFLSGNPDRPIIMAAIPNEHNPSLSNEKNATQPVLRTAGQNALEFEDKKDQQYARLASPTSDTVLHLGADPKNPEQTGIRAATNAHAGVRSGSYIQEVPGIFKQEIGQEGTVDIDKEPRLALQNMIDKRMADYIQDIALLPNATPAQITKALEARVKSNQSEIEVLDYFIEKELAKSPLNENYIKTLTEEKTKITDKNKEIENTVKNAKDGKIKDNDLKNALINSVDKTTEQKVKEKTTTEEYKEVNHMGMETTFKKNAIINNFLFGINNDVSFALDNSVFGGMKNSLTLAGTLDTNIGIGAEVNMNKKFIYNLTESSEYTTYNKNEVAQNKTITNMERSIKSLNQDVNTLMDVITATNKKTNVNSDYLINVGKNYTLESFYAGEITIKKALNQIVLDSTKTEIKNTASSIKVDSSEVSIKHGVSSFSVGSDLKMNGRVVKIGAFSHLYLG